MGAIFDSLQGVCQAAGHAVHEMVAAFPVEDSTHLKPSANEAGADATQAYHTCQGHETASRMVTAQRVGPATPSVPVQVVAEPPPAMERRLAPQTQRHHVPHGGHATHPGGGSLAGPAQAVIASVFMTEHPRPAFGSRSPSPSPGHFQPVAVPGPPATMHTAASHGHLRGAAQATATRQPSLPTDGLCVSTGSRCVAAPLPAVQALCASVPSGVAAAPHMVRVSSADSSWRSVTPVGGHVGSLAVRPRAHSSEGVPVWRKLHTAPSDPLLSARRQSSQQGGPVPMRQCSSGRPASAFYWREGHQAPGSSKSSFVPTPRPAMLPVAPPLAALQQPCPMPAAPPQAVQSQRCRTVSPAPHAHLGSRILRQQALPQASLSPRGHCYGATLTPRGQRHSTSGWPTRVSGAATPTRRYVVQQPGHLTYPPVRWAPTAGFPQPCGRGPQYAMGPTQSAPPAHAGDPSKDTLDQVEFANAPMPKYFFQYVDGLHKQGKYRPRTRLKDNQDADGTPTQHNRDTTEVADIWNPSIDFTAAMSKAVAESPEQETDKAQAAKIEEAKEQD